jgi:hypothetical protein
MDVNVTEENLPLYSGSTLKIEAALSYGSPVRVWRCE